MKKKLMTMILSGVLVLGAVVGLGAFKTYAAPTASPAGLQAVNQTTGSDLQGQDKQDANETEGQNDKDANEVEGQDETGGDSAVLGQAAISAEQAKAAAIQAVPGTAGEVELQNENGQAVYGVEVKTDQGTFDVKVDAQSGQVLAQEPDDQDRGEKADSEAEDGQSGPDNDQIEMEQ